MCDHKHSTATRKIANELQKSISLNVIPFPETLPLDRMEEYTELCQELVEQSGLEINTSTNIVTVIGFHPQLEQGTQRIQSFIKAKCSITTRITIAKEKWKLLCRSMKHKWERVMEVAKQGGVDICCPLAECEEPNVVLTGDQNANEKVFHMINQLSESINSTSIHVVRPGTRKYFDNESTRYALTGIETKYGVAIHFEVKPKKTTTQQKITPQNFAKVCMANTPELKRITVIVGDISEFNRADVIVNAANEQLQHIGGVAKAIVHKGGPMIQEDSTEFICTHGDLLCGDVILTDVVGNLSCRLLIHAVGPRWKGGHNGEEALLHKACYDSLKKARRFQSIALPAISTGAYGFPIERCAEVSIRAVIEFSSSYPRTELEDVYFAVASRQAAEAFVRSLKRNLKVVHMLQQLDQSSQATISTSVSPPKASSVEASTRRQRKPKKKTPPAVPAASPSSDDTVRDRIKIKKGSLLDIKVSF